MNSPAYDLLLYGDQCGNDLIVGEFLARRGLRVHVARKLRKDREYARDMPTGFLRTLRDGDISFVNNAWELIGLARKSRAVLTFTGSFGFTLNWRWPLRHLLGIPPVMNYPTGSDFSELLDENSPLGMFYRYFVRTCAFNAGFTYPHILKNMLRYRVANTGFVRHSYLLPPRDSYLSRSQATGRLRFFHPSHLDFKVNDAGKHRNSSKGNDRFLRAFIRALRAGIDAECVLLERGPDLEIAREIIRSSGYSDRFLWRQPMPREMLFQEMLDADVVVDQFDVGGMGGITLEAMALAKPVLIYLQPNCLRILYPEAPPVLNGRTEDQIHDLIIRHADRERLRNLGEKAHAWAYTYHSGETCLDQLIFHYSLISGHQALDYGWDQDLDT